MDQQKLQKVITFLESDDFEIKKLGLSFLGELYNIHSVLPVKFYQYNRWKWESFEDFLDFVFLKYSYWSSIIGKAIYYSILNKTSNLFDSIIILDNPDKYDLKNAIPVKSMMDLDGHATYKYYYPRIILDYK